MPSNKRIRESSPGADDLPNTTHALAQHLASPLPELRIIADGSTASSDSRKDIWVQCPLRSWSDFRQQASAVLEVVANLESDLTLQTKYHVDHMLEQTERIASGNEIDVSSRIDAHLHMPVLAYLDHIRRNNQVEMGSHHILEKSKISADTIKRTARLLPDCVIVDRSCTESSNSISRYDHVIVQERKHPFHRKHDLSYCKRQFEMEDSSKIEQLEFRKTLGQIVDYMDAFDCTYGILTTYRQTIALKVELDEDTQEVFVGYSPVFFAEEQGTLHQTTEGAESELLILSAKQAVMAVVLMELNSNVRPVRQIGAPLARKRPPPVPLPLTIKQQIEQRPLDPTDR